MIRIELDSTVINQNARTKAESAQIHRIGMRSGLLIALCLVPALSGCVARQVGTIHGDFRNVLLALQERQIMDNLIRAKERLPLLHIDYTKVDGVVTAKTEWTFGGSQKNEAGKITDVFDYSASLNNTHQISVVGAPVIEYPEVYRAYLDFVAGGLDRVRKINRSDFISECREFRIRNTDCNQAWQEAIDILTTSVGSKGPNLARVCKENKGFCMHVCGKRGDDLYWVPVRHRNAYLLLALRVTVRGASVTTTTTNNAFNVTIKSVDAEFESVKTLRDGVTGWRLTINLVEAIPNDNGELEVAIAGLRRRFDVLSNDRFAVGRMMNKITISYLQNTTAEVVKGTLKYKPEELAKEIYGEKATIRLGLFGAVRRQTPVERLLEQIGDETRLDRNRP